MEYGHAARQYLLHWLHSENLHSVHSPGLFSFCRDVIYSDTFNGDAEEQIESIRRKCIEDSRIVKGIDYGTGSNGGLRSVFIAAVAKVEIAPIRYARLYNRIVQWTQANEILEIGTSLGLTTLYLSIEPNRKVTTLEGHEGIASTAEENFKRANRHNIRVIHGDASKTLSQTLNEGLKPDLVLIDASHRYNSTMDFFDQVIDHVKESGAVIIDDIHSSREMTKAWQAIVQHVKTTAAIDLFRCGVVLLDKRLEKRLWRFRI